MSLLLLQSVTAAGLFHFVVLRILAIGDPVHCLRRPEHHGAISAGMGRESPCMLTMLLHVLGLGGGPDGSGLTERSQIVQCQRVCCQLW